MTKLLLTLSVLTALSVPAAAGRLDVDPATLDVGAQVSTVEVDTTITNSIGGRNVGSTAGPRGAAQSDIFGANSR